MRAGLSILLIVSTIPCIQSIGADLERCGFERPRVIEKIWPVFIHDPGKPAEMEIPVLDVLIDRNGNPVGISAINEIPEQEMEYLQMIIPAMKYTAGNACDEPIESFAKCVFYDYFVLRKPNPDKVEVRPPLALWKISQDFRNRLAYYGMTHDKNLAIVDFHIDAEGKLKKTVGKNKYGSTLSDKLFNPEKDSTRFKPASVEGEPVSSVIRLYLGSDKKTGRKVKAISRTKEPYHVLRPWPEELPIEEVFTFEAELMVTDEGIIIDIQFLSQLPSALAIQVLADLKTWKLNLDDIPDKDGKKSLMIKVAYSPEDRSPSLLEYSLKVDNIVIPKRLSGTTPVYPTELLKNLINGIVIMTMVITKDGSVVEPEIVFASDPLFGEACVEACKDWKYSTPYHNGKPINARYKIAIPFRIKN